MSDWNQKLDYLQKTRQQMWNDDYLEFLVKQVWKLDKPIDIIDFGCGYGYLGMKIMPLLPQGSTYTGIDIANELIEEAKDLFSDMPYPVKFEVADLLEFEAERSYDVAICQSVLRHIPQAKEILEKMIYSVSEGGMVICIEPNRRMENAGLYLDDEDYDIFGQDEFLKERWQKEMQYGGRDFLVGSKIPMYMEQLGLENVNVRVNDFVEFISSNRYDDNFEIQKKSFIENNLLNNQGMDAENLICARCHLISYGTKQ